MNPESQQSGIKTWQWVTTVIVIIILIVIGIWVFGGKGAQAPVDNGMATDNSGANAVGAINRIVMSDQYPGNIVYISSVQLANPGWVVIQANNAIKTQSDRSVLSLEFHEKSFGIISWKRNTSNGNTAF